MPRSTDDRRTLDAADLARLLARLNPDRERAAEEYERLRRALIKFFDWRGAWLPEEGADEAIDRLARKLEETHVDDVRSYALGIARLVLLERQRGPAFSSLDAEADARRLHIVAPEAEDERQHDCLERCLREFADAERSLLLRYYEGLRSAKIANRRNLAAALGVSETALRSRVQRLRDRLERCLVGCLGEHGMHSSR
jgi:DNA-directed RNA polymerase specialized sigma24 family protein